MFGNRSSSHTDNGKSNLFIVGEWDTFGINGDFGAPPQKKSLSLILVEQTQNLPRFTLQL